MTDDIDFFVFRWNGYNVQDYKKVVDEYNKLEMVGFHSSYSLSVILLDSRSFCIIALHVLSVHMHLKKKNDGFCL